MGGTYDKLYKEVPTYKLITPSIVSERLKVRGSLARRALQELESKNLIKLVVAHSSQMIYTRMIGDAPEDEKENEGGVVVSDSQLSFQVNFHRFSSRLRRRERGRRTRQRQKHWLRLRRSWKQLDLLGFYSLEGLFQYSGATFVALKAYLGHCELSRAAAGHQMLP